MVFTKRKVLTSDEKCNECTRKKVGNGVCWSISCAEKEINKRSCLRGVCQKGSRNGLCEDSLQPRPAAIEDTSECFDDSELLADAYDNSIVSCESSNMDDSSESDSSESSEEMSENEDREISWISSASEGDDSSSDSLSDGGSRDSPSEMSSDHSSQTGEGGFCSNCRRSVVRNLSLSSCYYFLPVMTPSDEVNLKLKFSNLNRGEENYWLCSCCSVALKIRSAKAERMKSRNIWAAYLWQVFITINETGRRRLWQILPMILRKQWVDSMSMLLDGLLLTEPLPVVMEITKRRNGFKEKIDSHKLTDLVSALDDNFVPQVLCPWGCTEFDFKCGHLSLDIMLQNLLPYHDVQMMGPRDDYKKASSMRSDFIRDDLDDYESLLFNDVWKVLPSMAWIESEGPVFMTCRNHHRGTIDRYFHLPRLPLFPAIPARSGDQLSHAVLRPRVVRATKRSFFNSTYETLEVRGQYGGIDSCNISQVRNFKSMSALSERNMVLSLKGRSDIKCLLSLLETSGVVTCGYVQNLHRRAGEIFDKTDLSKYKKGATYMSLEDCVRLQKMLSTGDSYRVSAEGEPVRYVAPTWPKFLTYIHPCECPFGAALGDIPPLLVPERDSRLLWLLSSMVTKVATIWEACAKAVVDAERWYGHVLAFCTRECLSHAFKCKVGSRDDFKKCSGKDLVDRISASVGERNDGFVGTEFRPLFSDIEGVAVVPYTPDIRNAVDTLSSDTNAMIVFVATGNGYVIPNTPLAIEICGFQLRLIATTRSTGAGAGQWDGAVFARHGGPSHGMWWTQTRRSKPFFCSSVDDEGYPEVVWSDLATCVYVRVKIPDIVNLREEYLRYLGCQSKVFCARHNLPLIVTPDMKSTCAEYHCYGSSANGVRCGRKVAFRCCHDDCPSWICAACLVATNEKVFLPSHPDVIGEYSWGASLNERLNEDDEEHLETIQRASEFVGQENLRVANETLGVFPLDPLVEECDDSSIDCSVGGMDFVTTDQGVVPLTSVFCRDAPTSNLTVPGHVVLNHVGSLLIRRGSELHGNKSQQRFIQKLATSVPGVSIPTVYPEGMLFPSVCWASADENRSIAGAIPSALLAQQARVKRQGVASLRDHARSRITSCSSLSGVDHKYKGFLYDALCNVSLNGRDSRAVLNRGFVEREGPLGVAFSKDSFMSDCIDSRKVVNELAASEKEEASTLFLSVTCNQSMQPGVRHIRRHMNDVNAWKDKFPGYELLGVEDRFEILHQMDEGGSGLLLRCWLETAELLTEYIGNSKEPVLCECVRLFTRFEYQDGKGNLPHLHMLLCTKEKPIRKEDRPRLEAIIAGCVGDIIHDAEVPELIREGLLKDAEEYFTVVGAGATFLGHKCNSLRCLRRTGPNNGDTKCRVPDIHELSPDPTKHCYVSRDPQHTEEAWDVMAWLALCNEREEGCVFIASHECLEVFVHYPPSTKEGEKFSPCCKKLFMALRGNQNLQIVFRYQNSRYLVKYVGKIDKNNEVFLSVDGRNENDVSLDTVFLHNTKITSSAGYERMIRNRRRDKNHPTASNKTFMEIEHAILGYTHAISNTVYEHVSTSPMEERRGYATTARIESVNNRREEQGLPNATRPEDLMVQDIPSIYARDNFPTTRKFSNQQVMLAKDAYFCPVSTDKITIFGVRPPEISCWVKKVELYFRWFVRSKVSVKDPELLKMELSLDVSKCSWYDALGNKIRLRRCAISEVRSFLSNNPTLSQGSRAIRNVMRDLCVLEECALDLHVMAPSQQKKWKDLLNTFVATEHISGERKERLPVVVFPCVKPRNATRFLLHLMLTMGEFETEWEMLAHPTVRECFIHAGLIKEDALSEDQLMEGVKHVLRSFVTEQLAYYPISTKAMDSNMISAKEILVQSIVYDRNASTEMPAVLYTSLRDKCDEEVEHFLNEQMTTVKEVVHATLTSQGLGGVNFPTLENLFGASKNAPHAFSGEILQGVNQTLDSFLEQEKTTEQIRLCLDAYRTVTGTNPPKSMLINGPPGCGKTFCLMFAGLYSLCKGLITVPSALLAERASELGGINLHRLFSLPPKKQCVPRNAAETAILKILTRPKFYHLLLCLDVLLWDELGQNSAQVLACIDMLLRKLRGRNDFFGGVVVISTIDEVQLRPIDGLPALLSPHILSSFVVSRLRHSVRAADDANLQRMIEISRYSRTEYEEDPDCIDEMRRILTNHCTWVARWDSEEIPSNAIRVFGKKSPARREESRYIASLIANLNNGGPTAHAAYCVHTAVDEQLPNESHGNWMPASEFVKTKLDKMVKEPRMLTFYRFGLYQCTFNDAAEGLFYSQLIALCSVPDTATLQAGKKFEVVCAPPGTKALDFDIESREQLLGLGWTTKEMRMIQTFNFNMLNGLKGRRKQYGMRHHIASTIHQTMGATLGKVATEISLRRKENALWEKGQIVVLLSRTRRCSDIYFVGEITETINTIVALMQTRSQFDEYICRVLAVLSRELLPAQAAEGITTALFPFRPRDIQLPEAGGGCCYLLVSVKNLGTSYIGETIRALSTRLWEHNSGHGAQQTESRSLRPWAVFAFVVGFEGNKDRLRAFEDRWRTERYDLVRRNRLDTTPLQVAEIANSIIGYSVPFSSWNLRMVLVGISI